MMERQKLMDTILDELKSISNTTISLTKYDEAALKARVVTIAEHYPVTVALKHLRDAHKQLQEAHYLMEQSTDK